MENYVIDVSFEIRGTKTMFIKAKDEEEAKQEVNNILRRQYGAPNIWYIDSKCEIDKEVEEETA